MCVCRIVGWKVENGDDICTSCASDYIHVDRNTSNPILASKEGWEKMRCDECLHTLGCAHSIEECSRCKNEDRLATGN